MSTVNVQKMIKKLPGFIKQVGQLSNILFQNLGAKRHLVVAVLVSYPWQRQMLFHYNLTLFRQKHSTAKRSKA